MNPNVRHLIYSLSCSLFFSLPLFYYRHFHRQFYVPRTEQRRDRIQSTCATVSHNSNAAPINGSHTRLAFLGGYHFFFFHFWVMVRPKDKSDTTRVSFILGRENNAMVDDFKNVVETGNDSSLSHNMRFGIYK